MNDPFQSFREIAERDGIAVSSTTDGYLIMVKREKLLAMLLSSTSPAIKIGIGTNHILLGKNELQMNLDAHPEAPMLLIVYTHQPIPN